MLKDIGLSILPDVVLEAIKSSDYHSKMAEESLDVFNKEQVVLYEMEKTDDTSIVVVIEDLILQLGLEGEKLRGQCYDGCSIMIGKKKGVATQIKKDI